MPDPITDLTATWTNQVGVTLGWTPPDDVTNTSRYFLSFVDTSGQFPVLTQFATLVPVAVKGTSTASTTLTQPPNTYTVQWSVLQGWANANRIPNLPNNAPAATVFSIIQVDEEYNFSDPVAIMALPQSTDINSPTHLANAFTLDTTGQFTANVQDTYIEVRDSIAILMGTIVGQRNLVPDYGVEDMALTQIDPNMITNAAAVWEDRADINVVIDYDDDGTGTVNVQIESTNGE